MTTNTQIQANVLRIQIQHKYSKSWAKYVAVSQLFSFDFLAFFRKSDFFSNFFSILAFFKNQPIFRTSSDFLHFPKITFFRISSRLLSVQNSRPSFFEVPDFFHFPVFQISQIFQLSFFFLIFFFSSLILPNCPKLRFSFSRKNSGLSKILRSSNFLFLFLFFLHWFFKLVFPSKFPIISEIFSFRQVLFPNSSNFLFFSFFFFTDSSKYGSPPGKG